MRAKLREIERVIFELFIHLWSATARSTSLNYWKCDPRGFVKHANVNSWRPSSCLNESALSCEKDWQVAPIEASLPQRATLVAGYTTDRAKLITPGSEARVARG